MKCRASVQTLQCNVKNQTHVLHLCTSKIFQNGDQIKKLIIMGVREPAADGYRVLRVEYIGRGRIIDNYRVSEVATNLRKILYKN